MSGDAKALAAFLNDAARYFENRPTGGEDMAHWSNVANAENCRNAAKLLAELAASAGSQGARTVKDSLTDEERDAEVDACMSEVRSRKAGGDRFEDLSPINSFLEGWMARARQWQ